MGGMEGSLQQPERLRAQTPPTLSGLSRTLLPEPNHPAPSASLPWDSPSVEDQHRTRRAPGNRRNRSQSMDAGDRIMRQAIKLQEAFGNGAQDRMWVGEEAVSYPVRDCLGL